MGELSVDHGFYRLTVPAMQVMELGGILVR